MISLNFKEVIIIFTKIKNGIKSFFKDIKDGFAGFGYLMKVIWNVTNDVADSHQVKDMGKNLAKSYEVNVNNKDKDEANKIIEEKFAKPKKRSISEIVKSYQNPATDDDDDNIPEFADILARQKAKKANNE